MVARTPVRVPAALAPPVQLMLARAVEVVPEPGALLGGCSYEMKYDGWLH